jgi:hypothetical protein
MTPHLASLIAGLSIGRPNEDQIVGVSMANSGSDDFLDDEVSMANSGSDDFLDDEVSMANSGSDNFLDDELRETVFCQKPIRAAGDAV